jgi:23S rRNA-intervening sequence protein
LINQTDGGKVARPHYRLKAWKTAMMLVRTVYEVTRNFPKEESYGLETQVLISVDLDYLLVA